MSEKEPISDPRSARSLIIGTRGSTLAMRQTRSITRALRRRYPDLQIVIHKIRTTGDADQQASLRVIGGQGVFVKEIEEALQRGTIDLAVHSLKDLPARLPPGLDLAAIPRRADVRDALISRSGRGLMSLPAGAVIGTGAARRAAQLRAVRPDLVIAELRGNVETRLRKALASNGPYDAIVLALAGLRRLLRQSAVTEILSYDVMLPAPGQGALGLEIRADDAWARELVAPLTYPPTASAVTAERAFLAELGVGCQAPVAALAHASRSTFWLTGLLAAPGGRLIRQTVYGLATDAAALGANLAGQLLEVIAVKT